MSRAVVIASDENCLDYISNETIVISTNIKSQYLLENNKIDYLTSLDLLGDSDRIIIQNTVISILNSVRNIYKFNPTSPARVPASYEATFFHYLRPYVHYWVESIQLLRVVNEKFNPDVICSSEDLSIKSIGIIGDNEFTIIGNVVSKFSKIFDLNSIKFDKKTHYKKKNNNRSVKKLQVFRRVFFKFQLYLYEVLHKNRVSIFVFGDGYNMVKAVKYINSKIPNALNIKTGFNVKNIIGIFRLKSFSFFYTPTEQTAAVRDKFSFEYRLMCENIYNYMRSNHEMFCIGGVSISDEIVEYIENNIMNEFVALCNQINNISEIFKTKTKKISIAYHATGLTYAIGELSQVYNVSGMLVPHGSFIYKNNMYYDEPFLDSASTLLDTHSPFVAIQTPEDKKYYFNHCSKCISIPLITGGLLFNKHSISKKEKNHLRIKLYGNIKNRIVFMHASTPRPLGDSMPGVFESIEEYVSNINDTISVISGIENSYLVIKLRMKSFKGLDKDQVYGLFLESDCYDIFFDGDFYDYLYSADMVISYASTAIIQSLMCEVPVLQYSPLGNYFHYDGVVLNNTDYILESEENSQFLSGVYSVGSYNDLSFAINWIIDNHLNNTRKKNIDWFRYILKENPDWHSCLLEYFENDT